MSRIKGNEVMLFMGDTHADVKAIAGSISCDLDMTADALEVSSPDSAVARDYIAGRTGWKMTISKLLVVDDIYDGRYVGKKMTVQFGYSLTDPEGTKPEDRSTFHYYEGVALVTRWSCSAKNGDYASGSFEFLGCGELNPIDAPNFILDENSLDDSDVEIE